MRLAGQVGPVRLVYLVSLVCLVETDFTDKPEKLDRPDRPDRLGLTVPDVHSVDMLNTAGRHRSKEISLESL